MHFKGQYRQIGESQADMEVYTPTYHRHQHSTYENIVITAT